VLAGGSHSAVLFIDGRLFLWGNNDNCQCGVDAAQEQVCAIPRLATLRIKEAALGHDYTLLIEVSRTLFLEIVQTLSSKFLNRSTLA
jgi:hypothetical protein